ncbi:type III secretion system export apparatus subunit SctS [Paracidovorax valerianellae]|uniref:Type III secretion protein S n=1 Tax=Paracidovorax valerianellae TaxID=187868 RepID=A0A1G7B3A5_9BURK|nr:type III secretion system export apparatus subunit SctS [Paracidovorax valerianellae]MDA8445677.1 type III secretion system export apparatus subunit SctS [Paracidovorax valerianellae]SDE20715.1 type III secretion protein S [Paracidovorax valerianellae]
MTHDNIVQLTSEALMLCLILSLPAVAVAAVVGLLVALVQAVTSLQDAAISQGIKLICVTVTVAVTAPWVGTTVLQFSQRLLAATFSP